MIDDLRVYPERMRENLEQTGGLFEAQRVLLALVGGLLESLSFVTGIRALIVLVAAFYLLALLRRPATTPPAAAE